MSGELWATWAGAGVALTAAAVASVQASKANRAATRSAAADERAAAAAERANELVIEQATKYVPGWKITRAVPFKYVLTNHTDETAHAVTVTHTGGEPLFGTTAREPEDVGPGEALPFMVMMAQPGTRLLVTWRRSPEGEPWTAKHTLP